MDDACVKACEFCDECYDYCFDEFMYDDIELEDEEDEEIEEEREDYCAECIDACDECEECTDEEDLIPEDAVR